MLAILAACGAAKSQAQSAPVPLPAGAIDSGLDVLSSNAARTEAGTFDLSTGFGETDNVNQTADKQSQTVFTTGLDFGYRRTGSTLSANVLGNLNFFDYLQGAYGSQFLGRLDGEGVLSLWEDRFRWVLQEDYGETQLNALQPMTPGNIQHTNMVATGPELILSPWERTYLELGARYIRTDYQSLPLDNWRSLEDVVLKHDLSTMSSISATAELSQQHFTAQGSGGNDTGIDNYYGGYDGGEADNYDTGRYYGTYSIRGARTQIVASVGAGQTNQTGGTRTEAYVDAYGTRQLSSELSLDVHYQHRLTDSSETFGQLRAGAADGIVVAPAIQTPDSYLENTVNAGLNYTASRTSASLTFAWVDDRYFTSVSQEQRYSVTQLAVTRQISPKFSVMVQGNFQQTTTEGVTAKQYFALGGLDWQAGKSLSLRLQYMRQFGPTGGYTYNYNAVYLTLSYHPLPPLPPLSSLRAQSVSAEEP